MGLEERDTTLLHIGKQCSHPSCLLVDFLPFPCDHCKSSFCQEHFTVTGHGCPEYDESKYNRVAPDCPFCKVPVAFPPGTDPNIKMEEHFVICPVYTGKELKKSVNRCSKPNCQKVMVVPISCENCRSKFCPSHRFPADHYCKGLTPSAAQPGRPNLLDRLSKQNVAATAATAASALSTIKNAVASTTASTPSSSKAVPRSEVAIVATARIGASNRKSGNAPKSVEKKEVVGSKSSASSSTSNPFSKVDRRARAENESRLKAIKEREKKGLMSEADKKWLEEYQAEAKGDCVVM